VFGVSVTSVGQAASVSQYSSQLLADNTTDMRGKRVSVGRAAGRYFGKISSGLTLVIGYLMVGFTEKKQALHDMMAGTLAVVKPTSR
jgi:uncharacterized RDD family membrane protein YckC